MNKEPCRIRLLLDKVCNKEDDHQQEPVPHNNRDSMVSISYNPFHSIKSSLRLILPMPPKKGKRKDTIATDSGNESRSLRDRDKSKKYNASDSAPEPPAPDGDEGEDDWLEAQRKIHCQAMEAAAAAACIEKFDENLHIYTDMRYLDSKPADAESRKRKACKDVGGASNFEARIRKAKHNTRTDATAWYEDFMYFQAPERRNQYEKHIDHDPNTQKKNPFRKEQVPGRLWGYIDGSNQEPKLRAIVEALESRFIGTLEATPEDGVGPWELRTRIPVPRRSHFGLGAEERTLNPVPALPLNKVAIETARAKVEDGKEVPREEVGRRGTKRKRGVEGPEEQNGVRQDNEVENTHTERRAKERNLLGEKLPTDRYVHDLIPTAWELGRTRLESGLFISAGETSGDWNTSYDQLGIVKPGYTAVEKDLIFPEETDAPEDAVIEETNNQVPENLQENGQGRLFEFWEEKRPEKEHVLFPTTVFAETSYGRLEREHVHMDLAPSSPVDTPPHSPIPNFVQTPEGRLRVPVDVAWEDREAHDKYKHMFLDHFGAGYRSWPDFKGLGKGEGFTVPYDPIDVAALPENLQVRYQTSPDKPLDPDVTADPELLDGQGRFKDPAPVGTSMRILRIAMNQPYQPPIRPPPDDADDDESSDDDGDLFRKAYLEASVVGAGGGVGGQGHGGDGSGASNEGGRDKGHAEVINLIDDNEYENNNEEPDEEPQDPMSQQNESESSDGLDA